MAKGGWRAGAGRPTERKKITDVRSIDVHAFNLAGVLSKAWQGSWTWTDPDTGLVSAEVGVVSMSDSIYLRYTWNDHPIIERVGLVFAKYAPRPWFLCAGCNRRALRLYMLGGRFRCRRCHDLRYQSQSNSTHDRQAAALDEVEKKIQALPPGRCNPQRLRLPARLDRLRGEHLEMRFALMKSALG